MSSELNRRSFAAAAATLGAGLASSTASAANAPALGALDKLDVAALQAAMAAGRLSAVELTRHCLKRIEALNLRGPKLRAVIELNPDALAQARALDAERRHKKSPQLRGPLHGIPVLLKDNIATADKMSTTAGSLALAGLRAQRDAHIVERLRAAGAVILGKTNLSEWANIRSNRSSSGWSSRGGQTRNPHVLNRSPSGSSSGSASAAAASLAPLTVGTETDGSICSPAQACGVVGFKPTVGLVSRAGIIPISASQDTAGPIVRRVADAAVLAQVLAGADPLDAITQTQPATAPDFLSGLKRDALQGKRIGVVRAAIPNQPGVAALFDQALATLREQGAILVDPVVIPNYAEARRGEFAVLLHELKDGLAKYLAAYQSDAPVKSLADVIAWNKAHADKTMPFFAQETLEAAEATAGIEAPAYLEALASCRRLSRAEGIDALFGQHQLDAVVGPTSNIAASIDHLLGDRPGGGGFGSIFAVAGYPHITVPMGQVGGLPVGLSIASQAWQDARVLAFAYAYEQASQQLRAPKFLPETGLN
ncbi:amidase [Pelomonas sp. V22]|uniref:amidase n=1 Tax=Pelomonas sp. V22 TaxID=2822139 RepID=UPI0024A873AD|nr:amidase [Pelomonas sp. V22]MDI4632927.1 amidase [Pelomonas sp. V22]